MSKHQTRLSLRLATIPRSFWYSLAFVGAFLGTYEIWSLHQNNSQYVSLVEDGAVAFASFAAFALSWIGVKRNHSERHTGSTSAALARRLHFWVPLAFSFALLFQGAGNILNLYHDIYDPANPPFLSLIVLLFTYPALLAGIFLLPRNALSGKIPLRFMMESFMLIVALFTFSWYFVLGPNLLQSQGVPVAALIVSAAYSIFDLVVISCLILLSRSIADPILRYAVRGISLAMILFVLTDTILLFQVFHSSSDTTTLSVGWMGGNFAIALSLQAMRWQKVSTISESMSQPSSLVAMPLWRSLFSYALVPCVIGLVIFLWSRDSHGVLTLVTYGCSLLLLVLLFIKQLVVMQEVHGLNRGFQRLQRTVDEKNEALQQANSRLEALATTDPLTELPNHRALVTALEQELVRSDQYQRNCSLLFFDLDHFKALNDGYGHAGGDVALQEFGALLRATLPALHTVGRWGGEEFIAILPEQDASQAAILAEELRCAVANHTFSIGGGMHLTCSIGIASSPAHALTQEALLQAADSAMYAAKRLGRNQIRLIDDLAVVALLKTQSTVEGREDVALLGTVQALELLMEKRDVHEREHAQRVGELLLHLAQACNLSDAEAQHLSLAGQLHDIGKIVLPDSLLQKQEMLTEQELASIHQHVQVGAEVVSSIPSLRTLAPIILAHHEWWNGMGYPQQRAREDIPFGARLLAVVDAYVAMTHARPYPEANNHVSALAELRRGAGTQFDPTIVEQFLHLLTTVQLTREESGIAA